MVATAVTMLGAAYGSRRKLPWLQTFAAAWLPRQLGCCAGGFLASAGQLTLQVIILLLVGPAVVTAATTGDTSAYRSISPVAVPLACLGNMLLPFLVMAGSAVGEVVGVGLMVPINNAWGRTLDGDEDPLPKDLVQTQDRPSGLDPEDGYEGDYDAYDEDGYPLE